MPIRRYLRVSKYTVLETRIHLENPALLTSWFLHPRDPVLPKVIEAVRGLVLPKLREETERVMRGGARSKKGRAVKDIVTGEGFEVTVYLTEGGTRHSVLSKTRSFQSRKQGIKSNSSKLLHNMEGEDTHIPAENENDGDDELHNIPAVPQNMAEEDENAGDDIILVESSDEEAGVMKDDKKPLTRTTYDGFSIYSRVLSLVVKKVDSSSGEANLGATSVALPELDTYAERPRVDGGLGMMDQWITMTQIARQNQDAGDI